MTTIKLAIMLFGVISGLATSLTAGIAANVPMLSNETPIALTFGLILGGLAFTAVSAWNVATAWAKLQLKVRSLEERLDRLEESSN